MVPPQTIRSNGFGHNPLATEPSTTPRKICVVALLRCCVVALLRCCVVALLRCNHGELREPQDRI
jgi:hypothetical protein